MVLSLAFVLLAWQAIVVIIRTSPDVEALRHKVSVSLAPEVSNPANWGDYQRWGEADAPMTLPSRARITFGDRVLEARSDVAKGDIPDAGAALSDDEILAKFRALTLPAGQAVPGWQANVSTLAARLLSLEEEPSVSALLASCAPISARSAQGLRQSGRWR